jgi:hypothetical protein
MQIICLEELMLVYYGNNSVSNCPTSRVARGNLTLRLSQNRTWQSPVIRLFPSNQFGLALFTLFLPLLVDNIIRPDGASPWLLSHYRTFNATTGYSAPVLRIGTLALIAVTTCAAPLTSKRQVLTFPTNPCYQVTPYFTPDAAWAGYR